MRRVAKSLCYSVAAPFWELIISKWEFEQKGEKSVNLSAVGERPKLQSINSPSAILGAYKAVFGLSRVCPHVPPVRAFLCLHVEGGNARRW